MYIIGVAGGTGSGKSTFCKLLMKKISESEIIDGDKLLNDTLRFYKKDFSRMFGERIRLDNHGRINLNFFTKNPARIKETVAIAKGYLFGNSYRADSLDNEGAKESLHARLTSAMEMTRDYMSESLDCMINNMSEKKMIVIIDWANLPVLDIWKKCDIKIVVSADNAQRLIRLKNRRKGRDFTEKELLNLIENAILPYDEIDYDVWIKNDRIEALDKAANEIRETVCQERL
ncbi:MAG: dephospho-CoA kinase [Eubacterium sp.]|jgi:dephospho-CoA kinase|nr:dephospho-CoA kinase [Eubacterium sp.]